MLLPHENPNLNSDPNPSPNANPKPNSNPISLPYRIVLLPHENPWLLQNARHRTSRCFAPVMHGFAHRVRTYPYPYP